MRTVSSRLFLLMAMAVASAACQSTGVQTGDSQTANGPKMAVRNLFRAMLAGDDKTFHNFVYYSDPNTQKSAEVMFDSALSLQRVRNATIAAFGDRAKNAPFGMSQQEAVGIEKDLDAAAIKITGDTAEISNAKGVLTYVLVLKNGQWKIDFEKCKETFGRLPPPRTIEPIKQATAAFDQLTVLIKGRRISTLGEVDIRVRAIQTPVTEAYRNGAPAPLSTRPG